jgi:hypothetical protein
MPDLLLELFSEEIPARMQARAAEDLKKIVTDRLVDAGLVYEGARAFATPRRLALFVQGVPAKQPDLKEERKGPRVGAPEGAIAGFLKAAGLSSISEASIQKDPKKGDFYIALTEKPGRPALEVLGELQATEDDPSIDAEPGKIVHEVRHGKAARTFFERYYGTADATPLYLILLSEVFRWTDDVALVRNFKEPALRALEWIDKWGDHDGDGFVEYERRSAKGAVNQSWKDSEDSQRFHDGSLAADCAV